MITIATGAGQRTGREDGTAGENQGRHRREGREAETLPAIAEGRPEEPGSRDPAIIPPGPAHQPRTRL